MKALYFHLFLLITTFPFLAFGQEISVTSEINPQQQVRDYVENGANVHEISQKLQAMTPGIYNFPQSKITGYVYMMSTFEGRIYLKPPLTAVAAPITLIIASEK